MNYLHQEIPIVSGWVSLNFHTGLFPKDRMLIELLRPDIIDPSDSIIQWCNPLGYDRIPDLGSQLLLQAWSDDIVRTIQDEQKVSGHLIDKLCHKQGLDCGEARYHNAVMMYIGALFPAKIQNLGKFASAAMQITSLYGQYQQGNVLAIRDNYAPLVSFDSATGEVGENPHKLKLRERFLDYRIADDYLHALYLTASENKGNELLAYLEYNQKQRDNYVRSRSDTYRLQVENIFQMVRQCPYCQKWYEQSICGNGKLSVHCKEKECFRAWDSMRRRKLNRGWKKASVKRKICRICHNDPKLTNADLVCRKCFDESQSQITVQNCNPKVKKTPRS